MDSVALVKQLRQIGLWPEDGPRQRRAAELSQRFPDARSLARELIQNDLLTPYQANQILTGKSQALVVGPYRVLERLGEGGTGQVFKARHSKMGRFVALKVIRPDRVTSPLTVGRFHREIQAAANLKHPNIVRAYDADKAGDIYYFAMEYVPGMDLHRLVEKHGPLPVAQVCDYVAQAALGLQHIHESGMVHRDIKPSNLMIVAAAEAKSGEAPPRHTVKILDLGLARLGEDSGDANALKPPLTLLGVVMGTADYMAPEQARDSRLADIRSDIYGLGCTAYFALSGRPPFPGGTALEKMLRHQVDEPAPLTAFRQDVPPEVADAVRCMMAKKPEDRYPIPLDVATALAPYRSGVPVVALPESAPEPVPEIPAGAADLGPLVLLPPGSLRHRDGEHLGQWAWVGAAAAALIGLVVLILIAQLLRN